jgi:Ni,Fe-hydrogenase III large subunit
VRPLVEQVAPDAWRPAIETALRDRAARFAGAWTSRTGAEIAWRVALVEPGTLRVLSCTPAERRVDTIADLMPAARWDEREARDLDGLEFDGDVPARALVNHPDDPAAWMTPVAGEGVHEVAVGPIHAGVIESGHFRFHVVGERILAMDPRLFYKHRGLERAAEGGSIDDGLAHVGRACAACAVTNTVAYAHAVESARGLWPDRELRAARTLLLELERLYNHLHDIGAICAGVGLAPGTMAFAALKERAQRINAELFGHRFLFATVSPGRGLVSVDAGPADAAREQLRDLRVDAAAAWRQLEFTTSLQARLDGIGVLDRDAAVELGAVGPAARGAGVRVDVRADSPRLRYDGFAPAVDAEAAGDVAARIRVRASELTATFDILDETLDGPVAPGAVEAKREPAELGVGRVESPRGATLCAVELRGDRLARLHLRTGSFANWGPLAHATAGNLLPDFPLINKSFELCYACVDR